MINYSFWKNKNVLITGHTGFKGSWLALWLIKLGAKVSGIGLPPNTQPALFEKLEISSDFTENYFQDIKDNIFLKKIISNIKPEIVFHLAAQPLVRESYKNPLETWSTNVIGSLNILDSLSELDNLCSVVMITTDKVYKNKEWIYGYRENDELGGHDPYSASKAACEMAIESWRSSFCKGEKSINSSRLAIATARSGNVIGGGDWSKDRIVPDIFRALNNKRNVLVRNPNSTRPWQHILEPLSGYLILAERLYEYQHNKNTNSFNPFATSFNFGPNLDSNKKVSELVNKIFDFYPGFWEIQKESNNLHEAKLLKLNIDKAYNHLQWKPKWDFETTIKRTVKWYENFYNNDISAYSLCLEDINYFMNYEIEKKEN